MSIEEKLNLGIIEVDESIPPLDHIYPVRPGDPVAEGTFALCEQRNTKDGHPSPPLGQPRLCKVCRSIFAARLATR